MAKTTKLSDYMDRVLITEKYGEFKDLSLALDKKIQDLRSYIARNGLNEVKSNYRVDREVARLCMMELEANRIKLESLIMEINIVESSADIIPFKKNKAA